MQRTTVVEEDGTERPSAASVDLARSAGQAPRARFRHVLRLALPVPAGSIPTVVGADLRGAFLPLEHDALHPPAGVPAATLGRVGSPSLATVALPGPRALLSVTVAAAKAGSGSSVEIHRLDGSTPSADPTVTGSSGGPVPPGFVDVRFGVQVRTDGAPVGLTGSDIQAVGVRTIPSGPTLGVAPSGGEPPVPVIGFWRGDPPTAAPPSHERRQVHAAARTGVDETIGERDRVSFDVDLILAPADVDVRFDVGADLATALQPLVAAATTDPVEVALVFEADQPCSVRVDALSVTYRAVIEAFDGVPAGDQKLSFDGGRLREEVLSITLPVGAAVASASMHVRSNLRADRSVPEGLEQTGAPPAGGPGVEVVPGRTVAGRLALAVADPPRATVVTGVAVPALPLADGSTLLVAVQEDRAGGPSGSDLGTATVPLGAAGQAGTFVAAFGSALTLPSSPHWVVVRAAQGRAVWLADPSDPADPPALVGPDAGPAASVPSIHPRATVLTPADGAGTSPLTVSVGGVVVAASTPGDAYDLVDALTGVGADGGPIQVRFASASKGTITVAPPRVEFDVP